MAEQMQYTPRPWRVVEKERGRYMWGYDAAADEAERLKADLAAARAEAERWRKRYEALRAKVESVAHELRKRAYSCAKDWLETGHHYHDGASDAYYIAEEMVQQLLTEAGGGDQ